MLRAPLCWRGGREGSAGPASRTGRTVTSGRLILLIRTLGGTRRRVQIRSPRPRAPAPGWAKRGAPRGRGHAGGPAWCATARRLRGAGGPRGRQGIPVRATPPGTEPPDTPTRPSARPEAVDVTGSRPARPSPTASHGRAPRPARARGDTRWAHWVHSAPTSPRPISAGAGGGAHGAAGGGAHGGAGRRGEGGAEELGAGLRGWGGAVGLWEGRRRSGRS